MSGAGARTASQTRLGQGPALALVIVAIAASFAWTAPAGPAPSGLAPGDLAPARFSPPAVPSWEAVTGSLAVVYITSETAGTADAREVADRLDNLLQDIRRDSGLELGGVLSYPLYPSAERFREDWWRFATLRDGLVHGWGTIAAADPAAIVPYQIARIVVLQTLGQGVPLLTWGLGDLIGDRLIGVDSQAHARLFLDRGGLPPIGEIVHQLDFSRALPGSYIQSVSFLAFLAEDHGLRAVVAFAGAAGTRWYDFGAIFERQFGITLAEADRRWRARLARVTPPGLSDAEFLDYQRAAEFVYRYTLSRAPGGLVSRPGGAVAYVEALRATDALRRLDLAGARQAARVARLAGETVERRTVWTRHALQAVLWALALGPILLAVLLLAGPSLRSAWRDRRRRKAGP